MLGRTFPLLRPGIGKENRHDGQYSDRGKVDRRRQIGILHQVEEEQGCQCKMETSHDEPKALDVILLLLLRGTLRREYRGGWSTDAWLAVLPQKPLLFLTRSGYRLLDGLQFVGIDILYPSRTAFPPP